MEDFGRTCHESFKMTVKRILKNFIESDEETKYEFPTSLSKEQRKYIHQAGQDCGLGTKSRGNENTTGRYLTIFKMTEEDKEKLHRRAIKQEQYHAKLKAKLANKSNVEEVNEKGTKPKKKKKNRLKSNISKEKNNTRCISVFKKDRSSMTKVTDSCLSLDENNRTSVTSLLQKFPVTNKERQDLLPLTEKTNIVEAKDFSKNQTLGKIANVAQQIPPRRSSSDCTTDARNLPAWKSKDEILSAIKNHQVVLISGETGSGKTTQIPQMILEECAANNKPCNIFCTQPRRISAMSVAERISLERGEKLGSTVGYQVKLEGKVSNKTLLTMCTTGVLLKTLMCRERLFTEISHVIVDEVHERDKLVDFLLIVLKEAISSNRSIKIVLMSANLDTELYSNYFSNCPIINIPGRMYPVKQYFLEHILSYTGYGTENMIQLLKKLKIEQKKNKVPVEPKPQPSECSLEMMDSVIEKAFMTGDDSYISEMMHLIYSENVPVNYQHTTNKATPLMIAAGRGRSDVLKKLFLLDADLSLKASNGWSAFDWAMSSNEMEAYALLEEKMQNSSGSDTEIEETMTEEDKLWVKAYSQDCPADFDLNLIYELIHKIHTAEPCGGILVFLPGYDSIMILRTRIMSGDFGKNFNVFCLHSSMPTFDQKKIFRRSPPGIRKIVLSTNIAETSVTIDDIIYVVDSGAQKENCYQAFSGSSSLEVVTISKASLEQRKGRAGRCQPGVAFHMMSIQTVKHLQPFKSSEIVRTPLQDLCLQAKLLGGSNVSVADFLSKAPEAPSKMAVTQALSFLKSIDAIDQWEDLTDLGYHLLDVSLAPHLAKMVLVASILKCLDPVLTIVCFLAYKDPFVLPSKPEDKKKVESVRKSFDEGMFSDHFILLKLFDQYQKMSGRFLSSWLEQNFLSASTMDKVSKTRLQIIAQLKDCGFIKNNKGQGDVRDLNTYSNNWPMVKAALLAGAYPRLIRRVCVDTDIYKLKTEQDCNVGLHQNSVLLSGDEPYRQKLKKTVSSLPSVWLFYDELLKCRFTDRFQDSSVRSASVVSSLSVFLFTGPMRLPLDALAQPSSKIGEEDGSDSDKEEMGKENSPSSPMSSIRLDSWISFQADNVTSSALMQYRYKLQAYILRRLKNPFKPTLPVDNELLKVTAMLLFHEDQKLGLIRNSEQIEIAKAEAQKLKPINNKVNGTKPITTANNNTSYKSSAQTITVSASKPVASIATASSESTFVDAGNKNNAKTAKEDKTDVKMRYFIVRTNSMQNIEFAQNRGVCTFYYKTEKTLTQAAQNGPLMLIFIVNKDQRFCGYSKFHGQKSDERFSHSELDYYSSHGTLYKLDNYTRSGVFFYQTSHLINPYTGNLPIHICRDGQEIEANVGRKLIRLFETIPAIPPAPTQQHFQQRHFNPPAPFHYMPRPAFYPPDFNFGRGYGFRGPYRGGYRR